MGNSLPNHERRKLVKWHTVCSVSCVEQHLEVIKHL